MALTEDVMLRELHLLLDPGVEQTAPVWYGRADSHTRLTSQHSADTTHRRVVQLWWEPILAQALSQLTCRSIKERKGNSRA